MNLDGYVFAHHFARPMEGREGVERIVARCASEVLRVVDDMTLDGEPSPEYLAFRRELGSRIFMAIRSFGVSPAIASLGVNVEGYAVIDIDRAAVTTDETEELQTQATHRVRFLLNDLPKTMRDHRQLYPAEEAAAYEALNKAEELLLDGSDNAEAEALLPELERWYVLAQKGIRVLRGDADALVEFDKILERARKYIAEHEDEYKHIQLIAKGEAYGTPDQIRQALMRLEQEERSAMDVLDNIQERRMSLERQL